MLKTRWALRPAVVAPVAVVFAILVGVALSGNGTQADTIWEDQASHELTAALHRLHEVWDKGDLASLKNEIVGDDALVTFELDPRDHTPIRLASKRDLDGFIDAVIANQERTHETLTFEEPVVNCRATGEVGICTEECTVHVKSPDGRERVDRLWSTAVAVKKDGRWKWVQWQMSTAAAATRSAAQGGTHHD
jgi:hypothetical protein